MGAWAGRFVGEPFFLAHHPKEAKLGAWSRHTVSENQKCKLLHSNETKDDRQQKVMSNMNCSNRGDEDDFGKGDTVINASPTRLCWLPCCFLHCGFLPYSTGGFVLFAFQMNVFVVVLIGSILTNFVLLIYPYKNKKPQF